MGGGRSVAIPLQRVRVNRVEKDVKLTTTSDECETFRIPSDEKRAWIDMLRGESRSRQRHVVVVDFPPTWEPPFDKPRVVPLSPHSPEYQKVKNWAETQQHKPKYGTKP